jgi:hypothetical protein
MSGVHKYPTISFRVSPAERQAIDGKIKASGMQKKDYIIRFCIYNRVCVVGKKETILPLVMELRSMLENLLVLAQELELDVNEVSTELIKNNKSAYEDMLRAIIWMLDGAKYLWQGKKVTNERENRVKTD